MSDTDLVAALAADLFGRHCAPDVVGAAADGWSSELWAGLRSAGLTNVGADPTSGGWHEIAAVVRAAGRHAAPVPIAEHVIALRALSGAGVGSTLGEPLTVAPAPQAQIVTLAPGEELLRGRAARVPYARTSAAVIVVASRPGGPSELVAVPMALALVHPGRNLAREPRDDVAFPDVRLRDLPHATLSGGSQIEVEGALARTLQIAGALQRMLDLTTQHARVREQFGRPIARFQAVQQQLARLAAESAAASAAADAAVRGSAAAGRAVTAQVAAAKVRAAVAATEGSRIAHQVHGAIGMTEDHQLHRFTSRLWSWRDEFGTERTWASRLGSAMVAAGEGYWERLTADLVDPLDQGA